LKKNINDSDLLKRANFEYIIHCGIPTTRCKKNCRTFLSKDNCLANFNLGNFNNVQKEWASYDEFVLNRQIGINRFGSGLFKLAIELLLKTGKYIKDPEIYYYIAKSYFALPSSKSISHYSWNKKKKFYNLAVEYYENVISYGKSNIEIDNQDYYNLIICYNLLDDKSGRGLEICDTLLKESLTNEREASILKMKADFYSFQDRNNEAIKYYKEAINKHPKCKDAYFNIASKYISIKKYNEARQIYKKVSNKNIKKPENIIRLIARNYKLEKKHNESIKILEEYLKYYPNNLMIRLELAHLYLLNNKYVSLENEIKIIKYRKINNEIKNYYYYILGTYYHYKQEYKEAFYNYNKSDDIRCYFNRWLLNMEGGYYEEAKSIINSLLKIYSEYPKGRNAVLILDNITNTEVSIENKDNIRAKEYLESANKLFSKIKDNSFEAFDEFLENFKKLTREKFEYIIKNIIEKPIKSDTARILKSLDETIEEIKKEEHEKIEKPIKSDTEGLFKLLDETIEELKKEEHEKKEGEKILNSSDDDNEPKKRIQIPDIRNNYRVSINESIAEIIINDEKLDFTGRPIAGDLLILLAKKRKYSYKGNIKDKGYDEKQGYVDIKILKKNKKFSSWDEPHYGRNIGKIRSVINEKLPELEVVKMVFPIKTRKLGEIHKKIENRDTVEYIPIAYKLNMLPNKIKFI
jgi:tetratricopeptide (TPR) repeat protein